MVQIFFAKNNLMYYILDNSLYPFYISYDPYNDYHSLHLLKVLDLMAFYQTAWQEIHILKNLI